MLDIIGQQIKVIRIIEGEMEVHTNNAGYIETGQLHVDQWVGRLGVDTKDQLVRLFGFSIDSNAFPSSILRSRVQVSHSNNPS